MARPCCFDLALCTREHLNLFDIKSTYVHPLLQVNVGFSHHNVNLAMNSIEAEKRLCFGLDKKEEEPAQKKRKKEKKDRKDKKDWFKTSTISQVYLHVVNLHDAIGVLTTHASPGVCCQLRKQAEPEQACKQQGFAGGMARQASSWS